LLRSYEQLAAHLYLCDLRGGATLLSYSDIGILLALISSVTTASAHALLKAGRDKLAVRALIGLVGTFALVPACFFVPLPSSAVLPWLVTASILHTTYQLVLIRAYEANDFAVAYPIARGIAPIATAVLGVALLGEQITAAGFIGIGLVSAGILLIALRRSMVWTGLVAAMIAGVLTTAYTIVDANRLGRYDIRRVVLSIGWPHNVSDLRDRSPRPSSGTSALRRSPRRYGRRGEPH
jgi:drug/metabolite transporter (DMT)-like permease